MVKTYTILFIVASILVPTGFVDAYDDETTHPALTSEIVRFYNILHPEKKLTPQEKAWIVQGSIEEDTIPRWINHFYDPIKKEGWKGENTGNLSPSLVRTLAQILVSSEEAVSAVNWANNKIIQSRFSRYDGDKTWKTGLQKYAGGDVKRGLIILGHILHLLEDMSVPEHTRNDTHAPLKETTGDEGSPFEQYLTKWDLTTIQQLSIPETLLRENRKSSQLGSIEEYLIRMAEYSNKYFFSKDTINDPKYEFPKILAEQGDFGYGKDENGDWFPLVVVNIDTNKEGIKGKTYSIKNKNRYAPILDSYFSRLSKKIVLEGAGVITLFLKQVEDERVAQEFPPRLVKYDVSFLETPSFSFLAEMAKTKDGILRLWSNVSKTTQNVVNSVLGNDQKENDNVVIEHIATTTPPSESEPENIVFKEPEPIVLNEEPETELVEEISPEPVKEEKKEVEEIPEYKEEKNKGEKIIPQGQNASPQNVFSGGGTASAPVEPTPSVAITEIMYNTEGSDSGHEWIEIQNTGDTAFDVSSLKFFENETNHGISNASTSLNLSPNEYAVIADDPELFLGTYKEFSGIVGKSSFSLSNDGESIAMKKGDIVLNQISYASSTGANGNGKSLQFIDSVWIESTPTPGRVNKKDKPVEDTKDNQAPIASFFFSSEPKTAGESVTFNAASSTDPDGTINLYSWNFGDVQTATSSNQHITHAYEKAGIYEVILAVFDDKGASSTASSSLEIISGTGKKADHVVISEVQVKGDDAGDEFIELYNPTDHDMDISEWSIQYVSGKNEVSTSTVFKKNIESSSTVPSLGFFLIARGKNGEGKDGYQGKTLPDLSYRTFSLSGSETGGRIFIVKDRNEIESSRDEDIIDSLDYSLFSYDKHESMERKAWNNGCVSSTHDSQHEFSGNGCDSDNDKNDFDVNTVSTPQNTKSFKESRNRPSKPEEFKTSYDSQGLVMSFFWNTSKDFSGNSKDITYRIVEASSSEVITETTSTAFSKKLDDIGKTYTFWVKSFDRDGLGSEESVSSSVEVPSFFTRGYLYKDTKATGTPYVFEGYYSQYPFINRLYSPGDRWRLVAFYKNQEAEKEEYLNVADQNGIASSTLEKMLAAHIKTCADSKVDSNIIILPDSQGRCNSVGPYNGDFSFSLLEDNLVRIEFPSSVAFSSKDYISVAYYDNWPYSVPRTFKFVARDARRYTVQEGIPEHKSPVMEGDLKVSFNERSSKIESVWGKAKDEDTLDSKITYEINFSPYEGIDNGLWKNVGNNTSYKKVVIPGDAFTIGVRAKDEFGNASEEKIQKWRYATTTFSIAQERRNEWSDAFGKVLHTLNEPISASFQSIVPEGDAKINVVVLNIWQDHIGFLGSATLRLTIYKDKEGAPDFTAPMGEAILTEAENYTEEQEIAFSFSSAVSLIKDTPYWFMFDVVSYETNRAFFENTWRNAVFSGTDVYAKGIAGKGFSKSPIAGNCDTCSFSGGYPSAPVDWYMKVGLRE